MKNFPTYFWRQFEELKENVAFVEAGEDSLEETTYWEWTRDVQKIAIGLLDEGFEPGTSVAFVAGNDRRWLDLAFAFWLVGGCIVPLVPDRDRRETLRCCARTGSTWIVVDDEERLRSIRGQGDKLPPLTWVSIDSTEGLQIDGVIDLEHLIDRGLYRKRRGAINDLAEVTFGLDPKTPALVLFPFQPGDDPHGAYFGGGKLAVMARYLAGDLELPDDRLAVVASYGWYYAFLTTIATLLAGRTVCIADSMGSLAEGFVHTRPKTVVCGPAYLEGRAIEWQERIEKAPNFLKDESGTGFGAALRMIGEKAAKKVLYDPVKWSFGGHLERLYLAGGSAPDEVLDILEASGIPVLGAWGLPEAGISHLERIGARRRGSVGRPVQGYACVIDDAKRGESGEILLKSDVLFDGYWDDEGPRSIRDGYLRTGTNGKIVDGYLEVERGE